MTLTWDETGERFYETGVDHGVLYIPDVTGAYNTGVAWNGLTTVTESPSGAEPTAQYADNIKYLNMFSAEELAVTIEAFTYPDEFLQFDGIITPTPGVNIAQQHRPVFGLCYRTRMGNDLQGENYGYKLHLLYGCMASPSEKAYATINDSPEAIAFSWSVTTTPVGVSGTNMKPTALVTVDSTKLEEGGVTIETLELILYGNDSTEPRMPLPDEIVSLFNGEGGGSQTPATGATSGTPGVWTPAGSTPPASITTLQASDIAASPGTAWATGEYVQTATAGVAGQAYWDGTDWVAGTAP